MKLWFQLLALWIEAGKLQSWGEFFVGHQGIQRSAANLPVTLVQELADNAKNCFASHLGDHLPLVKRLSIHQWTSSGSFCRSHRGREYLA